MGQCVNNNFYCTSCLVCSVQSDFSSAFITDEFCMEAKTSKLKKRYRNRDGIYEAWLMNRFEYADTRNPIYCCLVCYSYRG